MVFGIGTSRRRDGAGRHGKGRLLAQAVALALIVPTGLAQVALAAEQEGLGRPDVPKSPVTKVKAFEADANKARAKVAKERKANAQQAKKATAERNAAWPKPATTTLTLNSGSSAKIAPGGLPVTITPTTGTSKRSTAPSAQADGESQLTVLDQKTARKAGVTGVLLTAAAETPGTANVRVDYSSFASAIGGGWSQRLHLVQLPSCVLTTPDKAECRKQTPVPSDNDLNGQAVSAKVTLSQATAGPSAQLLAEAGSAAPNATVLAVTAASAGSGQSPKGAGDYSATKLSESSSWQAGGSSGSFTWSYDFTMPPAAAGPVPPLSLSYDSGSVDGRTATTNNQTTSVGEGFTITESYITRTYGSCDDDGHDDVFDQCWKYDNASLVLNGKSTRLVKDNTSGAWHLEDDDASTVTRSTGADNNDDNGEYWTVTTGDGTKYVFGKNKLDGAGTQRTNSTWTVPVFGDDSGEPGYSGGNTFADRALTQAWRWNLDYIEDTRGNAATYWYTKESNYYKKNKATKASEPYDRGGHLDRIEYGLRKDALFTDKADAKVTLTYKERCTVSVEKCGSLTKDTAENWPDVPFDAICSKDDDECNAAGPSFFTRKRLTSIDTSSYNATSSAYDPVDSWALTEKYLDGGDIGDSSDQVLTLTDLKRTAKAGDAVITVDPVTFTYQTRPNRVDGTDDILPLTRPRISTITSETGAVTAVTLSSPECTRSEALDAAPDTNTRSCYPQYWHINGNENAAIDWFHKYRVTAVGVHDAAVTNPAVEYAYSYSGGAWHYNDDPFTPKDERTWSDWRGYRQVTAYTGAAGGTRSKSVSLYLQGMHGDKKKDGTTKSVTVNPLLDTDVDFSGTSDADRWKGLLRQQVTYNGSQPISSVFKNYTYKNTATQTVPDAADHTALWVRNSSTYTSTYLTGSKTWRTHTTGQKYDDLGMVYAADDWGQAGLGGDETCTRTWYARNPDAGITSLVSRTRTVAKQCSVTDAGLNLPATSTTSGDVLADTATVYDKTDATTWLATQKPTKGQATWTGRATGYTTTADSDGQRLPSGWQTVATTTYDTLGRPLAVTDTAGRTTSTAYTPADAGPLTKTISTDPKGYRSYSFLDPRRGLVRQSVDINSKITEQKYDALGRVKEVRLPNRSSSQKPNVTFDYHLDNTNPSWVSTSTLTNSDAYVTSYAVYDSLLRPLQTQSPTPDGGRLLTDTHYDTRGLAYETFADIFDNTSTPNGTYTRAEYGGAPKQTETVFDGAARPTTSTFYVGGVKKWSTTTSYTGDSTATTALDGGSAQRTITDIRGKITETRTYAGENPADTDFGTGPGTTYTTTKFTYGLDGRQKTITSPDGATWAYGYDLFGRQTSTDDPDKGKATSQYNALDQVIKATDSRGKSILSAYDELGRPTGTWTGSKTDANQLTGYTYDTLLKGLPTSSTRYIGGKNGAAYTQTVTAYDTMGRATNTELQLPASDPFVKAGQSATVASETHYNIDGTLKQTTDPALGGLPSEIIGYKHDNLGNLTAIGTYLPEIDYSALAQPLLLTRGTDEDRVYVANRFEEGTDRLTQTFTQDHTHPYHLQELNYSYDQAGNVTSISDPTTLGGTSSPETQCFAYDAHQRLTEAWTPTTQNCTDTRNASALSGPAPYWTSYTYNTAGQRATETEHTSTATAKTTYCYTNTEQPHTLTGTTSKADCTTPERTYTYDTTGNTTKRPGAVGDSTQNLAWSDEGKLTRLTEGDQSTDYLYGADGTLLIRTTENGERVLYAGTTELHLRADGTTWAQRYYTADGITAGMRTNQTGTTNVTFLISDHHGTSSLAVDRLDQKYTKRYTTPFGEDRGKPLYGPWPDDKGFLGKTRDTTTGLTHIDAREYDPTIGQFISVDPLLEANRPQTLNGYSYGANNPLTFSDPSGMGLACGGAGGAPEGCPTRPDGSKGNGRPNEAVSTPPANWNNEGQGGAGAVDLDRDGQITLLPNLYIPSTTKDLQTFVQAFYNQVEQNSVGYGIASNADRDDWYTRQKISEALMDACYRTRCSNWKQFWASYVKMTIVAGVGEGGLGKGVGRGSKTGGCKCFLAGTNVLMADGQTKDIEDIRPGDTVMAKDPETGEEGPRKVTRLIRTEDDKHFNALSIATEDGIEKLTATHEHPFWSPSEGAWVEAGNLTPGTTLLTDDSDTVIVTANHAYTSHATTYNLTVDDIHTYYVLAGVTPVLVHNSNCDLPEGYTSSPALKGDPYHPDSVAERSRQNRELYAGTVADRAGALGYRTRIPAQKAPFNSHGQVVFSNGKNYITPDVDGHNVTDGWKMFNRRGQRIGTYDPDLNYLKE